MGRAGWRQEKKDKIFKMDKPNTRFTPAKSKGGKGPGYHVEFFYSITKITISSIVIGL